MLVRLGSPVPSVSILASPPEPKLLPTVSFVNALTSVEVTNVLSESGFMPASSKLLFKTAIPPAC